MKRLLQFAILLFGLGLINTYAQVGVNTTNPDPNSDLTLGSTDKGLLMNKVTLSETTNPTPLSAHVEGIMVYNTVSSGSGINGVVPGLYYNDGTQWVLLNNCDEGSSKVVTLNSPITVLQAPVDNTANLAANNFDLNSLSGVTVPEGATHMIAKARVVSQSSCNCSIRATINGDDIVVANGHSSVGDPALDANDSFGYFPLSGTNADFTFDYFTLGAGTSTGYGTIELVGFLVSGCAGLSGGGVGSGSETTTTLVNNGDGTYTYTNEAGTDTDINTVENEPWFGTDDDTPATENTEDIYHFGNIGLGITNPEDRLVLNGTGRFTGTALAGTSTTQRVFHEYSTSPVVNNLIAPTEAAFRTLIHYNYVTTGLDWLVFEGLDGNGTNADGGVIFRNRGFDGTFDDVLTIRMSNQRVGIKTNTPTADLSVNGSADKIGGGTWQIFSDARSKENILDYKKGLDALMQIRPVSFNYKEEFGFGTKTYVGLVAQEIEKVVPSMVTEIETERLKDFKQVDPNELTYILINSVQQLKKENEGLKKRLKEIELKIK